MKEISILGSTGSIGTQSLNVVRNNPDKFKIKALACGSNAELILSQAKEFSAELICIADENEYNKIKSDIPKSIKTAVGKDALTIAAEYESDTVIAAVVGMTGLKSALRAVELKKDIALANKESLVAAGEIFMQKVKENGVQLLPVDSEHNAVWQCIGQEGSADVERIILTASGGMFFGKKYSDLTSITPKEATSHPSWSMGKKITVDSSTMMNKGLEIIEAHFLFGIKKIDYVIHRQSIIHSMIEYKDGFIKAIMSVPNMEFAIASALSYPQRLTNNLPKFKFDTALTFNSPDEETFIMPVLAKAALEKGGNAPCILNSANEAAVNLFLGGSIKFIDIQEIVKNVLLKEKVIQEPEINDIYETHEYIMEKVNADYKSYKSDYKSYK